VEYKRWKPTFQIFRENVVKVLQQGGEKSFHGGKIIGNGLIASVIRKLWSEEYSFFAGIFVRLIVLPLPSFVTFEPRDEMKEA